MEYSQVAKSNSFKLKVFVLVIILVIVISSLFCYKYFFSRNGVQLLIDGAFRYLDTIVGSGNYSSVAGKFSVGVNFSNNNGTNDIFSNLDNFDLAGDYGVDFKRDIINIDLVSTYGDEDLIDMNVYKEEEKIYIYLEDIYNRYIDLDNSLNSYFWGSNTNDKKNIINGFKKALEKSLIDDYIVVDKVKVDGEKLNKTTLDLTGSNYDDFINTFIDSLLDDKKFLESYANIYNMDLVDANNYFNNILNRVRDYNGIKFIFYTKWSGLVKFEMLFEEYSFVVKKDNDIFNYELSKGNNTLYLGTFEVIKNKDNISFLGTHNDNINEIELGVNGDISFELDGKVKNKDITDSILVEDISNIDKFYIYGRLMMKTGVRNIMNDLLFDLKSLL